MILLTYGAKRMGLFGWVMVCDICALINYNKDDHKEGLTMVRQR